MAGGPYRWVRYNNYRLPDEAFAGGVDNGKVLYVARSEHNGGLVPGKFHSSHNVTYVSWGGYEHAYKNCEILCNYDGTWEWGENGSVPSNALKAGRSEIGETLYVGRVLFQGTLTIGKVQPSHNGIFIPYGGKEHFLNKYEVLVAN